MQTNNHKMMNKMIKVMKMQIKSDINVIILYLYYTERIFINTKNSNS